MSDDQGVSCKVDIGEANADDNDMREVGDVMTIGDLHDGDRAVEEKGELMLPELLPNMLTPPAEDEDIMDISSGPNSDVSSSKSSNN